MIIELQSLKPLEWKLVSFIKFIVIEVDNYYIDCIKEYEVHSCLCYWRIALELPCVKNVAFTKLRLYSLITNALMMLFCMIYLQVFHPKAL